MSGTYLTFDHWFQRREKIFANYHLFKIPYYYIDTIDKLSFPSDGWFSADELWRIINSRTPMMKRNQFVYDILGRSRKKNLTFCLPEDQLIVKNPRCEFISNVNVGDKVYTETGETDYVINKFERNYNGDMMEICPYKMILPFKVTPEHEVLIYRRNYAGSPKNFINMFNKCQKGKKIKVRDFLKSSNTRGHTGDGYRKITTLLKEFGIKTEKDMNATTKKPLYMEIDENNKFDLIPEWTMASEIQKNDMLVYPIVSKVEEKKNMRISDYYKIKQKNGFGKDKYKFDGKVWKYRETKIQDVITIDKNLMEFCGYYVSEGYADSHGLFSFAFGLDELDYAKRVKYLVNKIFGLKAKIQKRQGNHYVVKFANMILGDVFKQLFGKVATEKRVPHWLLHLPTSLQNTFFRAYICGDGYYNKKRDCVSYNTVSPTLSNQLSQILMRMGIIPSTSKVKNNKSKNLIYFSQFYPNKNLRGFIYKNFAYIPIKYIKKYHYEGKVYNLEVENNHSFLTMGSCVHNCFTTQVLTSIDKNVRSVLDFVASPQMGADDGSCLINIFVGNKASAQSHMKTVRFITRPFFSCYDTNEQIDMEFEEGTEEHKEPLLIFQPHYIKEHGYLCECEECGTQFFKDWESADKAAEAWWNKNVLKVFPNMRVGKS